MPSESETFARSRSLSPVRIRSEADDLSGTPGQFLRWLAMERDVIVEEWVDRVSRLSPSYQRRPRDELFGTVAEAFDANFDALSFHSLGRIERFIDFITDKRLAAGFPLSDVQKAFELFRVIVIEKLNALGLSHLLCQAITPINSCLAYTIHRFSDHFQHMHERALRDHAANLEREIRLRTAELAESERRYKTLVEEINDGYFVVQNGKIVLANQAFCRMHGATLEEVLGQPFVSFVSPECRDRVSSAYHGTFERQTGGGQLQYTRIGCTAEKGVTEVKSRVVDLGQGPVIIGICRDISARVAMEATVREHERMAYVGHLAASLSHEIRNPLSSVKMNLQILSRKLELDGFDRRRLEITVQQVSRLEGILRQLLDTARPLTIKPSPTDLSSLARGCVDLLDPKTSERSIQVVQRHPTRMPLVNADAGKVEEVVINLLLNAVEAVPEGGQIKIWTKAVRGDGPGIQFLELGVRDNGPGIDPNQMRHLFTPFYTSKARGTGLGMSNVKRIVEAHSGSVEVRNRKGRGATFIVRLPCNL